MTLLGACPGQGRFDATQSPGCRLSSGIIAALPSSTRSPLYGQAILFPRQVVALASAAVAGEPKKKSPEISSSSDVDKANLVNVGKNPYFNLEPGHRLYFKGDNTTLRITILHKTKVVDGVETRVVEEREEKDGQPTEISRNYFAIDKTTNAVYYFGEDVDMYREWQGGQPRRQLALGGGRCQVRDDDARQTEGGR